MTVKRLLAILLVLGLGAGFGFGPIGCSDSTKNGTTESQVEYKCSKDG